MTFISLRRNNQLWIPVLLRCVFVELTVPSRCARGRSVHLRGQHAGAVCFMARVVRASRKNPLPLSKECSGFRISSSLCVCVCVGVCVCLCVCLCVCVCAWPRCTAALREAVHDAVHIRKHMMNGDQAPVPVFACLPPSGGESKGSSVDLARSLREAGVDDAGQPPSR